MISAIATTRDPNWRRHCTTVINPNTTARPGFQSPDKETAMPALRSSLLGFPEFCALPTG
jgi:hypothetical protein